MVQRQSLGREHLSMHSMMSGPVGLLWQSLYGVLLERLNLPGDPETGWSGAHWQRHKQLLPKALQSCPTLGSPRNAHRTRLKSYHLGLQPAEPEPLPLHLGLQLAEPEHLPPRLGLLQNPLGSLPPLPELLSPCPGLQGHLKVHSQRAMPCCITTCKRALVRPAAYQSGMP